VWLTPTLKEVQFFVELLPAPQFKERRVMKQKLKTHKAMSKRVKVTASGKFMRRKVAISHLRRNKSPESVRSADKGVQMAPADTRRLKRLLPYAF
jgi:large subunit ribosomal protein L35